MQTHHKYNETHVTQYRAYGVETFCAHYGHKNVHVDVWTDGKTWRAQLTDEKPFAAACDREQLAGAMLNASSQVDLRDARPCIHVAAAWLNGAQGEIAIERRIIGGRPDEDSFRVISD